MGWFMNERGPAWKHGWAENALASMSPPPLPLLAIFLIILLLLYVSSYVTYKGQMEHAVINLKLFFLFLPVLLIFLARFMSKFDGFFYPNTKAPYGSANRRWDMPWGVVVLVVVLLVLASYRSSFRSMWSPIVWRSN